MLQREEEEGDGGRMEKRKYGVLFQINTTALIKRDVFVSNIPVNFCVYLPAGLCRIFRR